MTTNCDLEEMKHIVQQKFIELVDSGVEWEKSKWNGNAYKCGEWITESYDGFGVLIVSLAGEEMWRAHKPYAPEDQEYVIEGTGQCKPKQTKERKAYEKALAAFEADPMVAAIRKIEKVHKDRECEKRRQEMQEALESSCKALQKALKDTATTLAPEVQTGNTEPYTKPEGHPGAGARKWWQFWRGL